MNQLESHLDSHVKLDVLTNTGINMMDETTIKFGTNINEQSLNSILCRKVMNEFTKLKGGNEALNKYPAFCTYLHNRAQSIHRGV